MIVAFPGYLHLYLCKYSLFFVNILNQSLPTITDLVFSKDLCFDIFTNQLLVGIDTLTTHIQSIIRAFALHSYSL